MNSTAAVPKCQSIAAGCSHIQDQGSAVCSSLFFFFPPNQMMSDENNFSVDVPHAGFEVFLPLLGEGLKVGITSLDPHPKNLGWSHEDA